MNAAARLLESKILGKRASVAVIGLGYVGLPLAEHFANLGFRVTGIDLDENKVRSVEKGRSYVGDVTSDRLSRVVRSGNLKAVTRDTSLGERDVIVICVPTPLNRAKDPDLSAILGAAEMIKTSLRRGQLIILESTTYPGTTEEVILPLLEESGLHVGKDFFLCFSPERIDPGNKKYGVADIPKVVGGVSADCTSLAAKFYGFLTKEVFRVSSSRTAEMTKLLENTFRIVNIGLINELAKAAETLKVDIWEAVDAASTKPFGYMPFYPGPGIGGHCIGVDPMYLSWKARLMGTDLHFIDLARRVNAEMPRYVVSQAVYTLNKYRKKAISRSRVMLLGLSYKKDVADTRESPALDILEELRALGANVCYHDPYVPQIESGGRVIASTLLNKGSLEKQDLVILLTNHTKFNSGMIVRHSRLLFDTRNHFKMFKADHIVRL